MERGADWEKRGKGPKWSSEVIPNPLFSGLSSLESSRILSHLSVAAFRPIQSTLKAIHNLCPSLPLIDALVYQNMFTRTRLPDVSNFDISCCDILSAASIIPLEWRLTGRLSDVIGPVPNLGKTNHLGRAMDEGLF